MLEESVSDEILQQAFELAQIHAKEVEREEFEAAAEAIPDLERLDRYARRAWSQQKTAIRNFMNTQLMRSIRNADGHGPGTKP